MDWGGISCALVCAIPIVAIICDTVKKVFDFAYEMSYGTGEHRNHRSGGDLKRKNGESDA